MAAASPAAVNLAVRGADQLEQSQEDLHDVHVEHDGAVDVLLGADLVLAAAHDLLSVVHQVLPGHRRRYVNDDDLGFGTPQLFGYRRPERCQ